MGGTGPYDCRYPALFSPPEGHRKVTGAQGGPAAQHLERLPVTPKYRCLFGGGGRGMADYLAYQSAWYAWGSVVIFSITIRSRIQ
jgi:hypothetical protein